MSNVSQQGRWPREDLCSWRGHQAFSTCTCRSLWGQGEGGWWVPVARGPILFPSGSDIRAGGPSRARETRPGVGFPFPYWKWLKGFARSRRQWIYCVFREVHPQTWAHDYGRDFNHRPAVFLFLEIRICFPHTVGTQNIKELMKLLNFIFTLIILKRVLTDLIQI